MTAAVLPLDEDTPEALAWQADQDAAACARLQALPAYKAFGRALQDRILDSQAYPLRRAGDRWFQEIAIDATAELPVLVVRDAPTGEPRVLVDPNRLSEERGRPISLVWAVPSPDGKVLVHAVMEAGTEETEVALLDVETGSPLPDVVPWNVTFPPSWLPDSSGFYCTVREIVDDQVRMPTYRFELGQPTPVTPEAVPDDLLFPCPMVSKDGRHIALRVGNTEARTDWLRGLDGTWTRFLENTPGAHLGVFDGHDYIALVDGDAPRGRLVRIPVATAGDASTWTELVPESEDVLRHVDLVAGRLVLGYLNDAKAGIRVLDLEGNVLDQLAVSGLGSIGIYPAGYAHLAFPMFAAGDGEISFLFSTPSKSPALYRYVVDSAELELVAPAQVELDDLTVRQIAVPSSDGTEVPATLVHRADLDLTSSQPTLIHGYGGYSVALTPSYLSGYAPFVEAGGIFVLTHLRGGSEFGTQWWRAGRRERKQQVVDDLCAIADHLVTTGLTTPGQLAVQGGSNGGTLTGAALVQRPDLWAAVISQAPQLDLLGFDRDPVGYAIARIELGDPLVPEEAEWLRRLSPRHNIRTGARYPATLFVAGANDPRCPAWHSRVMTAELREATADEAPILLRVHADQGHGYAGRSAAIDQTAEWLAFAAHHTGLDVGADQA